MWLFLGGKQILVNRVSYHGRTKSCTVFQPSVSSPQLLPYLCVTVTAQRFNQQEVWRASLAIKKWMKPPQSHKMDTLGRLLWQSPAHGEKNTMEWLKGGLFIPLCCGAKGREVWTEPCLTEPILNGPPPIARQTVWSIKVDNQLQETEENAQTTATDQQHPASWRGDITTTKNQNQGNARHMEGCWVNGGNLEKNAH